jgi:hypothetical protein
VLSEIYKEEGRVKEKERERERERDVSPGERNT